MNREGWCGSDEKYPDRRGGQAQGALSHRPGAPNTASGFPLSERSGSPSWRRPGSRAAVPGRRFGRLSGAEGERILEKAAGSCLIALCVEGKLLSSEELAGTLDQFEVRGTSAFTFVIGSSFGLCDEVKKAAALRLSFSRMTFPHQLMRLMLCEQLYRACSISAGGRYHK